MCCSWRMCMRSTLRPRQPHCCRTRPTPPRRPPTRADVDGAAPSEPFDITCGSPQGGVLSPLLYLLFCDDKCGDERMRANGSALFAGPDGNDMVRVGNLMFADDLNTLSHTVEGLQENLDLCAKWAADGNVR